VLAVSGARDPAIAAAEEALAHLDGTPLEYDRARALLTLGQVLRRCTHAHRAPGRGARVVGRDDPADRRAGLPGPKPVEANLTRAYRKLGLRTLVELAHWFAAGAEAAGERDGDRRSG
jgi:hypothetical protein